ILMKDPGLKRDAIDYAEVTRRELRHADGIQPRRDRHRLLPVREPPPVSKLSLFLKQAIRNDLILHRGSDDELAGGFVVRVVNHRRPLPREVGPIQTEERPLAMLVLSDPEP